MASRPSGRPPDFRTPRDGSVVTHEELLRRLEERVTAKRYKRGCLILLTLPAILTVVLALYSAWRVEDRKRWVVTTGELVEEESHTQWTHPTQTELGTRPPKKETVTRYQYKFRVEGQDLYFWSRQLSPELGRRRSTDVPVYYNPRDPRQATVVRPEDFNAIPFYWALGASVLVWIVGKVTLKPR